MSKAVVFCTPSYGHINQTLAVVEALTQGGEQIIYYGTERFREDIEATGARFRLIPFDFSPVDRPSLTLLACLLAECASAWLPRLIDELRREAPDYVLMDNVCVIGRYVAAILGIPAIALISMFVVQRGTIPFVGLTSLAEAARSAETVRALLRFRRLSREIAETYGVECLSLPIDLVYSRADLNIAFTSELFQLHPERLDGTYRFIGPCLTARPRDRGHALPPLGNRPLVYVSLGTVFNRDQGFFRRCFEAFAGADFTVVLSAGAATDIASLGPIPGNFIVRNYIPQIEVLKRASVFISHGGMNSASESLLNRVPLIVCPQGADQFFVARRVHELGAGVWLRERRPSAQLLRETTERVLADRRMRERAAEISASFERAGGAGRGAAEILDFVARRRAAPAQVRDRGAPDPSREREGRDLGQTDRAGAAWTADPLVVPRSVAYTLTMSAPDPVFTKLMSLLDSLRVQAALVTVLELRLCEHLDRGPATAAEVAQRAGVAERAAQALLDVLVALDLVEVADGVYRNGPGADAYLVRGRPRYLGDEQVGLFRAQLPIWSRLGDIARSGRPAHASDSPEMLAFWTYLTPLIARWSRPIAVFAVRTLGLDQGEPQLLDVGGGMALYSRALLDENPRARATQADWPHINARAREAVRAAGHEARFDTIDGDLRTVDLGAERFEVAVVSNIMHQGSPAANRELLGRVRRALRPGGQLVVVEFVVDDGRAGPPTQLLFNLDMLVHTPEGKSYERGEIERILADAGFDGTRFVPGDPVSTLIFARRV